MNKATRYDSQPRELDFNDDERATRDGEDLPPDEGTELTAARARTAGLTGGEVPSQTVDNEGTADDLSPETLYREDGNEGSLDDRNDPADRVLSERPGSRIGAGYGKDEAELAEESPVSRTKPKPAA